MGLPNWIFNHEDKEFMRGDIYRSMNSHIQKSKEKFEDRKFMKFEFEVDVSNKVIKKGYFIFDFSNKKESDFGECFDPIVSEYKELDYNIVVNALCFK